MYRHGVLASVPDCLVKNDLASINFLAHCGGENLGDIARSDRAVEAALVARARGKAQALAVDLVGEILKLSLLPGYLHLPNSGVLGYNFQLTRRRNYREALRDQIVASVTIGNSLHRSGLAELFNVFPKY